jgi:hypothetical protein
MNKKDVYILLTPITGFLIVGILALLVSHQCHRLIQTGIGQEKYETFVENVQSGKWQITTDKWLAIMKQHQATKASNIEIEASFRELMLLLALTSLLGIVCQVRAVLHIRKRFTK